MTDAWWSAHTHSQFSVLDGMTKVGDLVAKAAAMGQPAIALTDHGNMAGAVQLYKAAAKHSIQSFPGVEAYLIDPLHDGTLDKSSALQRYHLGLMALDQEGYKALVGLVSLSHTRPRFSRFPRLTLHDLMAFGADHGDHVALTTGCYFGYLQQTYVKEGSAPAVRWLNLLASRFPHLFVEVQHHNICHDPITNAANKIITDDEMVTGLIDLADFVGLPIIATQDSHYTNQKEKPTHALMKRMVYGGLDDAFPGDSFHLASGEWVGEHYTEPQWDKIIDGMGELLDLNALTIPALDKFSTHVPAMTKRPDIALRRQTNDLLTAYLKAHPKLDSAIYTARLEYELSVITDLGMADYFLYMLECVDECRRHNVVVEARGSANGSLVTFLLNITQCDPIEYGLLFERFLSRDRIKPPDIDMDIESVHRQWFLGWLGDHYDTVQIGNFSELGMREEDDKGSVLVTYQSYLRRRCMDEAEQIEAKRAARDGRKPTQANAQGLGRAIYAKTYGHIQVLDDVAQIEPADHEHLLLMANETEVFKSYGVHASGVLVSGAGMDIADWIPTMLVASSNTTVSQFNMDDVEEWGLLKSDWLGQQSLTVMRRTQELAGIQNPMDFSWIPSDNKAAMALLRTGLVDTGLFHAEGHSKARGFKEMQVRTTRDVILGTALYMPGATESGMKDIYLHYRRNPQDRDSITYHHPVFKAALSDTYGTVIYQEQPLAILRALGMSVEKINVLFKLVKDSGKGALGRNAIRLQELHDEFYRLAGKAGIVDLDDAWHQITGFINYGFNKSHATGYGIRTYRTAFLKAHYPLEYMTALLETWAGTKKEVVYVREARRIKIRVLSPDVNISGVLWTLDAKRQAIRRGLLSIGGVGPAAAEEIIAQAPYRSVTDLASRCNPKKVTGVKRYLDDQEFIGTLAKLNDAGALESLKNLP